MAPLVLGPASLCAELLGVNHQLRGLAPAQHSPRVVRQFKRMRVGCDLYQAGGHECIMYGSDDLPVGVLRGKYVAFSHAWAWLAHTNHARRLDHCHGRWSFTRYEQLRAIAWACRRLRQPAEHMRDLFCNNASGLLKQVRFSSDERM